MFSQEEVDAASTSRKTGPRIGEAADIFLQVVVARRFEIVRASSAYPKLLEDEQL